MRLIPRWYQREANDAILQALTEVKNVNPLVAIVTGGGKALINAMAVERLIQFQSTARIMCLAPSMELVKQNVEEAFNYLNPAMRSKIGVYCAGLNMKERLSQITIGSPQSIANQVKRFAKIDYVTIDEAHTFSLKNKAAGKIVDNLRKTNPHVRFIGLTATPFFMKGVKVVPLVEGGLFDSLVYDLTSGRQYNQLTREGFISPVVAPAIRFPQIDTSNIKTRDGDFDEAQLALAAMKVTQEVVTIALENAIERKHFMWFAVNIAHAKMIQDCLDRARESSVIIHGELEKNERVTGIDAYLTKQHRHIVSVAMLTTGFNAKFVDCIVCLRPTRSLVLWRQIIGRGLRPYPDKENLLALDAGGNFARHGAINAEIGQGDSRSGLWECTDQLIISPFNPNVSRETSSIRFPVQSAMHEQNDLRTLLGLLDEKTPPCGFLNDAEHMLCRQCGRPRQGYLTLRQAREGGPRGMGEGDGYEIHDEDNIILRDDACKLNKTIPVYDMKITPVGNSILDFIFETEFGDFNMKLDYDRTTADNKFYAQARKFWRAATGNNPPNEGYRAVLLREIIPKPNDITLTKFDDNKIFITEVRFVHNDKLSSFRYDPAY